MAGFIDIWIKSFNLFYPLKITVRALSVSNSDKMYICDIWWDDHVKISWVLAPALISAHQFGIRIRAACTGVGSVYDH